MDYAIEGDAIIQVHNAGKDYEERMEVARCDDPAKAVKMLERARYLNDVKRQYTASARVFGHNPERGTVHAIEIDRRLAGRLQTEFPLTEVHCNDFLENVPDDFEPFDRILMNPPFERGSDITHIKHAAAMLNQGGKLVAICANGPRQREALQPMAAYWEDLPAGTFSEQGTGVNTALLVIEAQP